MSSPTSRTLEHLRKQGWYADKVEQRLPIPPKTLPNGKLQEFHVTRDVFGFGDILAVHCQFSLAKDERSIMLVQVTSRGNVNSHITKLTDPEIFKRLTVWLAAGGHFEIHGWDKGGAVGKAKRWRYRRVVFKLNETPEWTDTPMLGEGGET